MTTVQELIDRLEKVSIHQLTMESLDETKENILESQKEQLLEGKTSEGTDITPSYLDDPYFKSRASAQRYSDWKDEITPNSKRSKGTPNLYINGHYHSRLEIEIGDDDITTSNSADFDPDVERKYGNKLLGLEAEKLESFTFGPFWGVLKQKLEEATKLQFV